MSHPEQLAFFRLCADVNAAFVLKSRVIEIGAYDVNGSIRAMFSGAREYCGVDLVKGPGVDKVAYGHEVDDADGAWDIALSAECFEHDPHWRDTLANMVRLVRPGGLIVVSCASRGRVEHGTRRTSVVDSPGTQFEGLDYYRNVLMDELQELPLDRWFDNYLMYYNPTSFDLYLAAVRKGGDPSDLNLRPETPSLRSVTRLRHLMTPQQRLFRLPLRVACLLLRDEGRYQRIAIPYWLALIRVLTILDRGVSRARTLTRLRP
jgi:SAM-dependent methyltransferase